MAIVWRKFWQVQCVTRAVRSSSCTLSNVDLYKFGQVLFCKKIGLSLLTSLSCLICSHLIISSNRSQKRATVIDCQGLLLWCRTSVLYHQTDTRCILTLRVCPTIGPNAYDYEIVSIFQRTGLWILSMPKNSNPRSGSIVDAHLTHVEPTYPAF